ncbi:MAG: class I SAM-dependent methyltransferase [Candidatus Helarchaeota archaeon]|nr:class I SAM-dependent methyltransferase [Candidatus Helarchaeota archaeon]
MNVASDSQSFENSSLDERTTPLISVPWETGTPRKILINLVRGGLIKKGSVLDLCSGTGSNALYLADNGSEVTGINLVSLVLENRDKSGSDYLKLPYINENFDLVLDLGCFHHISSRDRDTLIEEIFRVLNDGGHYLIVVSNYKNDPTWKPFSQREFNHYFSKNFKIKFIKHMPSIRADGAPQYFYAVLMQKR